MSEYQYIKLAIDDKGIAVLTLNRPERYNAFHQDMVDEWYDALQKVANNPGANVVIVTGAGKAFCAGGDVDEMTKFIDQNSLDRKNFLWEHVHRIALTLERLDRPVIAALNGTARGAGLDMALMCDIRIAAKSAVFAESYINMGLPPGDGGTYYLPRLIGVGRALEMFWTAKEITAEEAERYGMVNRVVPDGEAFNAAYELALKIVSQPQQAIRFTKRALYQSLTSGLAMHLDMISSHMSVLEDMPDFKKKLDAFKSRKAK
ncbi:MAG: enoyl-CoA hydratase [Betaproteobacteria bacterium]|jgi:enoyl-CoA hydratase/carnithine racemase|nr:enoyl-CoA hydratase/isomerase family protein [Rhodocyclaceae bacterium]MCG3187186.1 Short-chain-enoyl-CoA hydratase [Rhodocyclaceae bacterium]